MLTRWLALTQLSLISLALVACGDSHGLDDDAGTTPDAGRLEEDAGGPIDASAPGDAGGPLDAGGPRPLCAPEDVTREHCGPLCDGPGSFEWDGERCVYFDCGACRGPDCGGAVSQEECEDAHATCTPSLCTATGGDWLWWAEECGHYECGLPPPAICESGMPVCDCGSGRRFEEGVGCVTADCPEVDPLPPETLCTSTGGSWENICCNTICGEYCPLDCAAPACNCGPMQVFDSLLGCVVGRECVEHASGDFCSFEAPSRCEEGTICCDSCGGAGCAGMPRCIAPSCDADPDTDLCGNNRLAP